VDLHYPYGDLAGAAFELIAFCPELLVEVARRAKAVLLGAA
jgi:hypothetical protein